MKEVVAFTSCNYYYMDRATVLARSIKKYHPEWSLRLLLCDHPRALFQMDLEDSPFDEVFYLSDFDIPDIESWIFKHDVVELCTAAKGPYLQKLVDEGYSKILYFDPDTVLFSRVDDLVNRLDEKDILLTPHQLQPEQNAMGIRDNEHGSTKWGVFNLGFLAIANKGDGREFAKWWGDRLLKYCYDDLAQGVFVDQKLCDQAPCFFPNMEIVRDPGCNVASWNIGGRSLAITPQGAVTVNGSALKFFHFTKLGPIADVMTERYARNQIGVYELWSWYRRQVENCRNPGLPQRWHWGYFSDGTAVQAETRRAYRSRPDLQRRFPNPYASRERLLAAIA
jgi:hypothetical protein